MLPWSEAPLGEMGAIMGVGPWSDGSQPAEPPEQPTKWKYGFGCALGGVVLTVGVVFLAHVGATAARRLRDVTRSRS
jgi:hypothetical protein